MIWKKKSGACKQVKKEEAAVRLTPMGAASTVSWSSSSPGERRMQDSRSKPCKRNSTEGSKFQPLLCTWQEEKKEEKRLERSKRKEQPFLMWLYQRQVGAMRAFWLVLFLILLGTRMQTVRAVEEEISIRREMDRKFEKVHVHPHKQQQQMQEDENL